MDFILFYSSGFSLCPFVEEERGQCIRAALQTLAELNTFADIADRSSSKNKSGRTGSFQDGRFNG